MKFFTNDHTPFSNHYMLALSVVFNRLWGTLYSDSYCRLQVIKNLVIPSIHLKWEILFSFLEYSLVFVLLNALSFLNYSSILVCVGDAQLEVSCYGVRVLNILNQLCFVQFLLVC